MYCLSLAWRILSITLLVCEMRATAQWFEHSFYMQETVNWSSKLTFSRERLWGTAPVNVRSGSKKHNAVRQADSGLGGKCSRESSEAPLRPDSPLPVRPLNLMTFAMGGTPHAGSRHPSLSEFSTVYCDPHSQRLWHSQ